MKTKLLFNLALFIMAFFTFGCSASEDDLCSEDVDDTEYVEVPIGLVGEILDVEESPLSRANSAKDWYAFQVYAKDISAKYPYYYRYAYGFFDNKEDMVINLKKGYEYKFDVQMIKDGSQKVYSFSLQNAGWTGIGNSFFISSDEGVRYMYEGYLYLEYPSDTFDRPDVDRFFGRTEGFVPQEGKSVDINMKRVSFGVKFVPKNFKEGNLEISIEGAPMIYMDSYKDKEVKKIISFNRLESAYMSSSEYSEDIAVNIVWVKPDNKRVPIASQAVTFKRNKLMTISFEVKEQTEKSSFNLKTDEVMEEGETVEIGGDGTNTDVIPDK